ncbi:hypothetical protein CUJ89_07840 [Burkholderia pyrrocinia]|uniref:Abortive infection protein n=1 Tax=Burkholderia pyrrocinia TaxID=60550 RepID=A0A2Z5MXZ2_BURPY|nr:hypothetical protein [Burkholderia pyrrocinia]AXF22233.1 hypothetical protein CUJ89_07840 [Burkholderia pyrrocinia]
MKYRGVVYDVGLRFTADNPYSVEHFDPKLVAYDINTIATRLHANAIRIEGEEIERLVTASRIAHAAGLAVFFNPWKMNVPIAELPAYFAHAARAAEQLRSEGTNIVFVAGCEMSLFNDGILEGSTVIERVHGMIGLEAAVKSGDDLLLRAKAAMFNEALGQIVDGVRKTFKGPVTYSAGMWEAVDWSPLDIVGIDHYRNGEAAEQYTEALDRYRFSKPLVVMEVGSCAYDGAGKLGAGGFMRLQGTNPDGTGIFTDGIVPTRSEREQADYVEEQLELLNDAGVDGVFIYVFSFPTYRHGEGARDLDMMSFSLVKTYPDDHLKSKQMPPWEPKEVFHRIAHIYKKQAAR